MPKFTAHKFPDNKGIIYINKEGVRAEYTYSQLDALSNAFANFLLESGLAEYDRVSIYSFNSDYYVISMFGVFKAKGVFVPINYLLTGREMAYQVNNSESSFLLVENLFYKEVKSHLTEMQSVKKMLILNRFGKVEDKQFVDFEEAIKSYSTREPDKILNIWDPILIMYTSGTESLPKGVILTNQSVISEAVSAIIASKSDPNTVILHSLPLQHVRGLTVGLIPNLIIGATNIIIPRPDVQLILETVEKYKVTALGTVPTMWIAILNHPDLRKYDLSSIEVIGYGASKMPVEVLKKLKELFHKAKFYNYYGQTEATGVDIMLFPEDHDKKLDKSGKELVFSYVELMDDNGDVIKDTNKIGEIVIRGPQIMVGYYKNSEATEKAFMYDWFHSGDMGIRDDESYLQFIDRKKDMIKSGGENVSALEVEEIIYKHPAVKEVAVVGLPDPKWIEVVTAVVVLKDEFKGKVVEEDIIKFCKQYLSSFKVPKRVIFLNTLPKNPTGKIMKNELKKILLKS
ncbi:AMP-binding protein [Candidatus Acidianus copahuensis]|uniref:AMP-binding protein n=1 Tax=Candidatus Acidianus copahuensis TaxID=1160895 RepID=UPI0022841DA7|nr:AMP-binding protein [Candidatus Acidianus copahuensis]